MTGKLASPTFVTGAKDDLATVDVYKQQTDTPVNSIQDQQVQNEENSITSKIMRGGKSMLSNLPAIVNVADKGLQAVSSTNPLQRATGISSVLGMALKNFSPETASGVFSTIGKFSGPISAVVGSVSRVLPIKGLGDIRVLSDTINQVTGTNSSSVKDRGGIIGTGVGIIDTAVRYGLPGTFGAFSKATTVQERVRIANGSMSSVIKAGDIITGGDIGRNTPKGTTTSSPGFSFNTLFGNYKTPASLPQRNYTDEYGVLKSNIQDIDSGWDSCRINNQSIPSSYRYSQASPDLKKMLSSVNLPTNGEFTEKAKIVGDSFGNKITDVYEGTKNFFSSTSFSWDDA